MKNIYTSKSSVNGMESRLTIIESVDSVRLIVRDEIPGRPVDHETGFVKSDVTVSMEEYLFHKDFLLANVTHIYTEK